MRYLSVLLVVILSLNGASCGNEQLDKEAAAKTYKELTPVPPLPSPTPIPSSPPQGEPQPIVPAGPIAGEAKLKPNAPESPKVHNPNLIPNGSFEEKDEQSRPLGWIVSPLEVTEPETAEPVSGQKYLALKAMDDRWGIVASNISVLPSDIKKPIRVEAWGMATHENDLIVAIVHKVSGKEVEIEKSYWANTGEKWEPKSLLTTLPENVDLSSLKVRFLLRQGSKAKFALDGVRAYVDVIGANASLDDVDKNGRPFGWIVSPADILVQRDVKPYDGPKAIGLKAAPDNWGILAHKLTVEPSDVGRTLTVSAWGLADFGGNLTLTVQGKVDDKIIQLGADAWDSAFDWTQKALSVKLPANLDTSTLEVRITVRSGVEGQYAVDHVEASLK